MPRISSATSGWLIALLTLPLSAAPLRGQVPNNDDRNVRVRIETDRAMYRAADSISIRIAFTNTGSSPVRYVPIPAWASSRLRVTDDSGRVIAPTSKPSAFNMISSIQSDLPAGATRVQKSDASSEWADLRRWGYDALRPGRYSIEGAPLLAIVGATPDSTLRSNRVVITVTP
jgi:hypothetical protein